MCACVNSLSPTRIAVCTRYVYNICLQHMFTTITSPLSLFTYIVCACHADGGGACLHSAQMMKEKGKPEAEQARYRIMKHSLSAKVLVLETAARAGEVQAQARSDRTRPDLCVRERVRARERYVLRLLTISACSPADSSDSFDPSSGGGGWCLFLHRPDRPRACVRASERSRSSFWFLFSSRVW